MKFKIGKVKIFVYLFIVNCINCIHLIYNSEETLKK